MFRATSSCGTLRCGGNGDAGRSRVDRRAAAETEAPGIDVAALARSTVVVVGDLALDHYLVGAATRLSREAPVPILEHERDDYRPGAAGNTIANLRALGCTVRCVGWVGDDFHGDVLLNQLAAVGADRSGVV